MTETSAPRDILLNERDEVAIRQDLVLTALGKRPADRSLRVGRLFDVHSRTWLEDQEIVIRGKRIVWVGPAGTYEGEVAERHHEPDLAAVPGFGEVHKHIESSHPTPEYEAALVMPRGNTWTCEASHEFSNVNGPHNLDFWFTPRRLGSPLKGQVPASGASSKGMQRIVTLRSVLICSSTAALPFQCVSANPPWASGLLAFFGVKKA